MQQCAAVDLPENIRKIGDINCVQRIFSAQL